MPHTISLGAGLSALWVMLSGHFDPLLLGLGLLSVIVVVSIASRMDIADHEGHPVHLRVWPLCRFWAWLLKEVVVSNLDVARRILSRRIPISPTMIKLTVSQPTEVGRVIYANSITLTPGTVSIDVKGNVVEVHALTQQAARTLEAGEMDRRVTAVDGGV